MSRFPNGARVCFIGDSITHNNLALAHIVSYYRENFADAKVEFYNCGISGGRITTTLNSFEEDVLPYNPTHAVIMIGINDSDRTALNGPNEHKYSILKNAFECYKTKLVELCDKLTKLGTDITLCTPTPYAEYITSSEEPLRGGSALMLGYAEYIKTFAKENGYPVCDYHSYMTEALQTEELYCPDFVHPNNRGQYHMAKCFLAFQGYDLGEEKPLPDDVQKWHETVGKIRNVYASVHQVLSGGFSINGFALSKDQRAEKIKEYLENEQTGPYVDYFKQLASEYPELDAQLQENIQFVIDFMKNQ